MIGCGPLRIGMEETYKLFRGGYLPAAKASR
jgi:hypothetical protein